MKLKQQMYRRELEGQIKSHHSHAQLMQEGDYLSNLKQKDQMVGI